MADLRASDIFSSGMGASKSKEVAVESAEISPSSSASSEKDVPVNTHLKRWPDEPQPLEPTTFTQYFLNAYDVALCLVPCALIIKAGLCIVAYHVDKDNTGDNIDQATTLTVDLVRFNYQLTTLFTILFVLVVSTTVKRVALWKAQKGEELYKLEQYQASVSLPSTLKAIWSLRSFTLTSVILVFVWAWYYVGSQASEHEYTLQPSDPLHDMQLAYLGDNARSPFEDNTMSNFSQVSKTDMIGKYHIYIGKVVTGSSPSPWDMNGYPLVPWFGSESPKAEWKFNKHGFLDLKQWSERHVVNAIGTTFYYNNVFNQPGLANNNTQWYVNRLIGKFEYSKTQLIANCSSATLLNQTSYPGVMPVMTMAMNMTPITAPITIDTQRSFTVWNAYNNTHSLSATCSISQVTVEMQTVCTASGCKAIGVKPRPQNPDPTWRTPFDSDRFASEFFNSLLLACGVPQSRKDLSTLEYANGWNGLKAELAKANNPASEAAALNDPENSFLLSMTLTNHINTFLSASKYMRYEHALDQRRSTAQEGLNSTIIPTDENYYMFTAKAAIYNPRYEINWAWIAVDIVSNAVLLAAAIIGFWIRKHTIAPDVFGYVSSLTRDNPNFALPNGGSTLGGMDRSRRMKHVSIKLGNVERVEEVGRVGLTDGHDPSLHAKDLESGKRYM